MRVIALSILLAQVATVALAQVGPSTLGMTCGQAAGLVVSRGAIVLSTGATTYDRFVVDRRFCQWDEVAEPAWVRTRDAPQCLVGGVCRPRRPLFFER